jgi:hypothetical protein
MADLFTYLKQTQRFLRDSGQSKIVPSDLVEYINRARREIAGRTMCVRRLTPISGQVVSATMVTGGINYSTQTNIVITPPDFPSGKLPNPSGAQALALPIVQNGMITAIDITYGGDGYFQPELAIIDPSGLGTGASANLNLSPINVLAPNQEQYAFSDINVAMFPGVSSVYMIKSISVIYANYRYSLPMYSFSVYQSMIRQYPFQYTYVPTFSSQYGQGDNGSFFLYPWPSQEYQIEFDCFCLPEDMDTTNQIPDVIPQPWADIVPYFAAHLAYLELGNMNGAKFYLDLFDNMTLRKSNYARPGRVTNPYGRW